MDMYGMAKSAADDGELDAVASVIKNAVAKIGVSTAAGSAVGRYSSFSFIFTDKETGETACATQWLPTGVENLSERAVGRAFAAAFLDGRLLEPVSEILSEAGLEGGKSAPEFLLTAAADGYWNQGTEGAR